MIESPHNQKYRAQFEWEGAEQIGQGSYGKVYKMYRTRRNGTPEDLVAVKVCNMKKIGKGKSFMLKEIELFRKLRHPNVVNLLDCFFEGDNAYFIYEYVQHDLMGLLNDSEYKFTEAKIKNIMLQLFSALEFIHSKGYMHRDIKPANIFINARGELKLGDFSLCTRFGEGMKHQSVVVSLWYRAPELIFGETIYGPEIDMWAVGCVLGEMFKRLDPNFKGGVPALFNQSTDIGVLAKIFPLCGTPPPQWVDIYKRLPKWNQYKPPRSYRRDFNRYFPQCGQPSLRMLNHLLHLKPDMRSGAGFLKKHSWFKATPRPVQYLEVPQDRVCNERMALERYQQKRKRRAENQGGMERKRQKIAQGAEPVKRCIPKQGQTSSQPQRRLSSNLSRPIGTHLQRPQTLARRPIGQRAAPVQSHPDRRPVQSHADHQQWAQHRNQAIRGRAKQYLVPNSDPNSCSSQNSSSGGKSSHWSGKFQLYPGGKFICNAIGGNFYVMHPKGGRKQQDPTLEQSLLGQNQTLTIFRTLTHHDFNKWVSNNSTHNRYQCQFGPFTAPESATEFQKLMSMIPKDKYAFYVKSQSPVRGKEVVMALIPFHSGFKGVYFVRDARSRTGAKLAQQRSVREMQHRRRVPQHPNSRPSIYSRLRQQGQLSRQRQQSQQRQQRRA